MCVLTMYFPSHSSLGLTVLSLSSYLSPGVFIRSSFSRKSSRKIIRMPAAFTQTSSPEENLTICKKFTAAIIVVHTMFFAPIGGQLPHVVLSQLDDIAEQWQRLWTGKKGCTPPPFKKHESEYTSNEKSYEHCVQHLPLSMTTRAILPRCIAAILHLFPASCFGVSPGSLQVVECHPTLATRAHLKLVP